MSILDLCRPRLFRTVLQDADFPVRRRLEESGLKSFLAAFVGETTHYHRVTRNGRDWSGTPGSPERGDAVVALVTSESVTTETKDVPALPGGNTEEALAKLLAERPQQLIRDSFDKERAYHAIPLDTRRAQVFSVRRTEVEHVTEDVARSGMVLAHAFCGLAVLTKYALAHQARQSTPATAIVVNDQAVTLTIHLKHGRPEGTPYFVRITEESVVGELAAMVRGFHPDDTGVKQQKTPLVAIYTSPFGAFVGRSDFSVPGFELKRIEVPSADLCLA